MRLGKNSLQLVPETFGMDVPNTCTIVIIAGENKNFFDLPDNFPRYPTLMTLFYSFVQMTDKTRQYIVTSSN